MALCLNTTLHLLVFHTHCASLFPVPAWQSGVIGLACARAAALSGLEVVLLEAVSAPGTLTSSRHSEVLTSVGVAWRLLSVLPLTVLLF